MRARVPHAGALRILPWWQCLVNLPIWDCAPWPPSRPSPGQNTFLSQPDQPTVTTSTPWQALTPFGEPCHQPAPADGQASAHHGGETAAAARGLQEAWRVLLPQPQTHQLVMGKYCVHIYVHLYTIHLHNTGVFLYLSHKHLSIYVQVKPVHHGVTQNKVGYSDLRPEPLQKQLLTERTHQN